MKSNRFVFAHSIDTIKDLYQDGILPEAEGYLSPPYPFLLAFYDAQTTIEQELYLSWMEYRQRAFQGAFHNSPDYMHWYGWAPLKETDRRIEDEATRLRAEAAAVEAPPAAVPAVPAEVEKKLTQMESDLAGLSDGVSDLTGLVQKLQEEVRGLGAPVEQAASTVAGVRIMALGGLVLAVLALVVGALAWRRWAS